MSELKAQLRESLDDMKANDITVLDVQGKTSITDYLMIASARSDRHAKAIAERLVEDMRNRGVRPLGVEGFESPSWILIDFCDVVVHIMQEETRQFYALEQLWATE